MVCSKCGAPMAETDTFCRACGQQAGLPAAASTGLAPSTSSPLPTAPPYGATPFGTLPAGPGGGYYQGVCLDPRTRRPLASWWRRVGAYAIDAILIIVVLLIVDYAAIGSAFTTHYVVCRNVSALCQQLTVNHGRLLADAFVFLVVTGLYTIPFYAGSRGQTIGMRALSIGVRDANEDRVLTYGSASVRWLLIAVFWMALIVPWIIDILSPLWDKRRQAWHDHAAGSVVVDLRWAAPTT